MYKNQETDGRAGLNSREGSGREAAKTEHDIPVSTPARYHSRRGIRNRQLPTPPPPLKKPAALIGCGRLNACTGQGHAEQGAQ